MKCHCQRNDGENEAALAHKILAYKTKRETKSHNDIKLCTNVLCVSVSVCALAQTHRYIPFGMKLMLEYASKYCQMPKYTHAKVNCSGSETICPPHVVTKI